MAMVNLAHFGVLHSAFCSAYSRYCVQVYSIELFSRSYACMLEVVFPFLGQPKNCIDVVWETLSEMLLVTIELLIFLTPHSVLNIYKDSTVVWIP